MHARRCRTFEEVLGGCSLSLNRFQKPHSEVISSRRRPIWGLACEEAMFETYQCVRMVRFRARSERETKDAGLPSHSQHKRWVKHNDYADLRIRSIGQDSSLLWWCDIMWTTAVHSTECGRWSDLPWPLLQRCHRGTQNTPMEKQPTEHQTEESLDDNPPPEPTKLKKKLRELAGLDSSLEDAWNLPAKGSLRNCAGKLAKCAQLALEHEELEDMIPIYSAAAISDDY